MLTRMLKAPRPSAPMLVALIALVSSLASGAVAAKLITGNDIKNRTITAKDLKRNAVNTKKVKNGSLLRRDFKAGRLPAGAPGPPGPPGEQGEKGDAGEPGSDGSARAFAFVDPTSCPSNVCATSRNRNVAKVERALPIPAGVYCITVSGVSSSEDVISMAGVDFRNTDEPEGAASALADSLNAACDPGEFQVTTQRADLPLNVVSLSNTVGFWFAVP